MSTRLGLEAVLYRNSGTYNVPVLVPVDNAKDVTMNLEKGSADVSTRGGNGWKAMVATLKDASIDFSIIWNTTDANFTAIKTAFLANDVAGSTIEFFIMSADVDVTDSEGLRASCMVEKFTINQPLEEAISVDVTIRPTYATNAPSWVSGTTYAAYD